MTKEGDGHDAVYAHNPKDAGTRQTQGQPRRPQHQGGKGSGGRRWRDEAGEESAVRAADDYKEPNRRSLAPLLFPPGWRERSGSINVREDSLSSADGFDVRRPPAVASDGDDTGERSAAAAWRRRRGSSRDFSADSAGGADGGNAYHEDGAGHMDARDAVRYVASTWIDGHDGGGDDDNRHVAAFRDNHADEGSNRAQREGNWDTVGGVVGEKGDRDEDRSRFARERAGIRAAAAAIADSFGNGPRSEARGETSNEAVASNECKDATSASRCDRLPRAGAPEANTVAADLGQDEEWGLPRDGKQQTGKEGLLKESPDRGRRHIGVYGIGSYESQREGKITQRTPLVRRERGARGVHELTSESAAWEVASAERSGRKNDGCDAGCTQQYTRMLESPTDSAKSKDRDYSNLDPTGVAGNDPNARTSTNGAQRQEETRVLASLSHMGFTAEGSGNRNVNATATGSMDGDDHENSERIINYRLHENGIGTAPPDSTDRDRRAFEQMSQGGSEAGVTGGNNSTRVKASALTARGKVTLA